jgi:hypothetical protein
VSVGFGLVKYPVTKSKADSVRELQLWLAGILADTAGVLLARAAPPGRRRRPTA